MRIVIADDDSLVGLSLKTILEAKGCEVAALGKDGREAVELYNKHFPDALLMDIQMKEMNGLDAAALILEKHPDARILLLTTFSDDEYIVKAIRLGAKGYILKQNFDSIYPAITAVCNGQTVFGDEIMNRFPTLMSSDPEVVSYEDMGITEKEFSIVRLVAEGLNNREISEKLYLGEGTVRNYISVILEKLYLRDRTQLAVFYYKHFV